MEMEEELKAYYKRKSVATYDSNHVTNTYVYIERQKAKRTSDGFGVTTGMMRLAKLVRDNLVIPPGGRHGSVSNGQPHGGERDNRVESVNVECCNVTRVDVHCEPELVLTSGGDFSKRANLVLTPPLEDKTLQFDSAVYDLPQRACDSEGSNLLQTLPNAASQRVVLKTENCDSPESPQPQVASDVRPLNTVNKRGSKLRPDSTASTSAGEPKSISGDVVIHMPEGGEGLSSSGVS